MMHKYDYFRLNIPDDSTVEDTEMVPANLGDFYQNQESDPDLPDLFKDLSLSDELPDLPSP